MTVDKWRTPRSLLFVPATKLGLVAKVDRWAPDLVVLDLEDAVRPEDKESARAALVSALTDGLLSEVEAAVVVRVNGPETAWHHDDLVALAPQLARTARGVVVPKVDSVDTLAHVRGLLEVPSGGEVFVMGGLETAQGVADSRDILASRLLDAVYFGAEDYVSDLGGRRTDGGEEVRVVRSLIALHARLAGVMAVDQAFLRIEDHQALAEETIEGISLGYAGKICIHPGQVAVVHKAHQPSAEEVAHAKQVLDVAALGVGTLNGAMVDAVHVRMAQQVLSRAGG